MIVRVYLNTNPMAMLNGYSPGDILHLAHIDRFDSGDDTDPPAEFFCELAWAKHNADDRPKGSVMRSLSLGDVVGLSPEDLNDDSELFYSADVVGFELLDAKPIMDETYKPHLNGLLP